MVATSTAVGAVLVGLLVFGPSRTIGEGAALDASTVRIDTVQRCPAAKTGAPNHFVCVQVPDHVSANSTVLLFKVVDGGKAAVRTTVKMGRQTKGSIEVQQGLSAGERVIISDMSAYENFERVELR